MGHFFWRKPCQNSGKLNFFLLRSSPTSKLTSGSSLPDLALATYRERNTYVARTCLTLKMAYSNARLIVQPQSSWLTTNI